jgi:hypothetical protein
MIVIAFLVVLFVQLCRDPGPPNRVASTSDTPILILLLQPEGLLGTSGGVGNLGVVSRSG